MSTVARLGSLRLARGRLNVYTPIYLNVTVDGTNRETLINKRTLVIEDNLRDAYDVARFVCHDFTPSVGEEVVIGLGETHYNRLFGGRIQKVTQIAPHSATSGRTRYEVTAVDWGWDLNNRLVLAAYQGQTATAIVLDLIATYTTGFTTVHVQAGLDTIDDISFINETVTDALTRLSAIIGGVWYVDPLKDLHFFTSESLGYGPQTLSESLTYVASDIRFSTDLSQIRTQVIGEGVGTQTTTATDSSTSVPVEDVSMFPASSQTYRIGPVAWASVVATAAGDSGSGPNYPLLGPVFDYIYNYDSLAGGSYSSNLATDVTITLFGNQASSEVNDAVYFGRTAGPWQDILLALAVLGDWDVALAYEYWDGATWAALTLSRDAAWTSYGASVIGFDAPVDWAATTVNSVSAYWMRLRLATLTSITTKPVSVTPRRGLYPGDTVRLPDIMGGSFPDPGSSDDLWVLAGGQWLRDQVGGGTGFPASGAGSVQAPISPLTDVYVPPRIESGSGAFDSDLTIPAGSDAVLRVTRTDSAGVVALGLMTGGDGIREAFVRDGIATVDGITARADADLALYADPIKTLTFTTRDPNVRSGLPVTAAFVASPHSAMNGTYTITRVVTQLPEASVHLHPTRQVEAASVVTSDFYNVLRRMERATQAGAA